MFSNGVEEGFSTKKNELKDQSRLINNIVASIVDEIADIRKDGDRKRLFSVSIEDETIDGCTIIADDKRSIVLIERRSGENAILVKGSVTDGAGRLSQISLERFELNSDSDAEKVVHAAGVAFGKCIATLEARGR